LIHTVKSSRNIVICCDGTSNEVSTDTTNVLRLFRTLVQDDSQICWYDPGVGATPDPTKLSHAERISHRLLDMAAGASVHANVCRGYRFLSETWRPGDRIWLFGFSRGAYTARAIAGMIRFLGLAKPEHAHLDTLAWTIFAAEKAMTTASRFGGGSRFGESFCWPAEDHCKHAIHFVGVWDTVSSFGMIWDLRTLPYTSNNDSIAHIRHAVAIDEQRAMFQPCLFYPRVISQHDSFKERWFAGTHGDVGGGWPEPKAGLAKISLEWMYNEAERAGARLDPDKRAYFLGCCEGGGLDRNLMISITRITCEGRRWVSRLWHLIRLLFRPGHELDRQIAQHGSSPHDQQGMSVDLAPKLERVLDRLHRVPNGPRHRLDGLLNGLHRSMHQRGGGMDGFRELALQCDQLLRELYLRVFHLLTDDFGCVAHGTSSCKISVTGF